MDIFIDKLAQKISSSEMIKANSLAEAKEINELKAKIEGYEDLLTDIRRLNLKNMESAEVLNEIIDGNALQTGKFADLIAQNEENIKRLEEMLEENLKASEEEALGEELSKEEELNRDYVNEIFEKTSDVMHQESVRVYRNVQAAMQLGLEEQTKSLIDSQNQAKTEKKNTFLNVMSVLILIAVLGDIAIKILDVMGII